MAAPQRVARLRALAKERGYDAVVIRNNPDLRWLTGAERVFDFESAHTAFITQDKLFVHTDSRYYNTFLERLGTDSEWRFDETWTDHPHWIVERAIETGARTIAIEDTLPLSFFHALVRASEDRSIALQLPLLHGDLVEMRAVKDAEEIAIMKEAQAITDKAFIHMCEYTQVGMTEKELQAELEGFMYQCGADALAFSSIVACGSNSANPHAMPGQSKVKKGDFVLFDYGAGLRDYNSDMTRTVVMGEPSDEQRHIYDTVLKANRACTAFAKPGVLGREVHELAAKIIDEAGYAGKFQHGLGHGVGVEIHEQPCFSRKDEHVIVPGNVVTIEPGIYIPGLGGVRIEDYGVITENGYEAFTQSTHELQIL